MNEFQEIKMTSRKKKNELKCLNQKRKSDKQTNEQSTQKIDWIETKCKGKTILNRISSFSLNFVKIKGKKNIMQIVKFVPLFALKIFQDEIQ